MPLIIRGNILQSRGRVDWLPHANAAQPSLTFSTDPDTGIYHPVTDNQIALVTSGADRVVVHDLGADITGNVVAGGFSGNGHQISHIQVANVDGLADALDIIDNSSVTTNVLTVNGNVTAEGITGNGHQISHIQVANVDGLADALNIIDNSSITTNVLTVSDASALISVAGTGTSQYTGSIIRLGNGADLSTRKNINIGTAVRDADGNNSYFSIEKLSNVNVYESTIARYDLSADEWTMTGKLTLGDVVMTGMTPLLSIASTATSQYSGSTVHLVNNAHTSTRQSASIGSAIRDADGNNSYFYIDALSNANTYLKSLAAYDLSADRWSFKTTGSETLGLEPEGNLTAVGNILAAGDITAFSSDERLKSDIHPLESPLEMLGSLDGYRFTWRDDIPNLPMRGADMGLLAQDLVRAGASECVTLAPFDRAVDGSSKSGNHYLTVSYNKVHAISIAAIKELVKRVDALQTRVDLLENRDSSGTTQ